MKFLVIVHAQSPLGQAYWDLYPKVRVGPEQHLGIVCTEMDASNPLYMFVRTEPNSQGALRQALHLPHGNVLLVLQYAENETPQIGFVQSK